jgi:hypothetical protein
VVCVSNTETTTVDYPLPDGVDRHVLRHVGGLAAVAVRDVGFVQASFAPGDGTQYQVIIVEVDGMPVAKNDTRNTTFGFGDTFVASVCARWGRTYPLDPSMLPLHYTYAHNWVDGNDHTYMVVAGFLNEFLHAWTVGN